MHHAPLPQHEPEPAWIQVSGAIAIHRPGQTPRLVKGSSRILLAVLVASGQKGISLPELANIFWGSGRPCSWRPVLLRSVDLLQKQLPVGWKIDEEADTVSLTPGEGWIDAWRLQQIGKQRTRPEWLVDGDLFAPLEDIAVVNNARRRLSALVPSNSPAVSRSSGATALTIRNSKRLLVIDTEQHQLELIMELANDKTQTHMIVGDAELGFPFAPYSMAFPLLRSYLDDATISTGEDSTLHAWQLVAQTLADHPDGCPQRLVVANAHELDPASRLLTTLLIERGPLNHTSLIMFTDGRSHDHEWLSFVNRSLTAGCEILDLSQPSYSTSVRAT